MCKNAAKSAYDLMVAVKPTFQNLLTYTGLATTANGIAATNAYNAALTALQNWQSGTPAQDVLEAIQDFQSALSVLQPFIPAEDLMLLNVILGGIEAVIGLVVGNSPAPDVPKTVEGEAPVIATVDPEDAQATHQTITAVEAMTKIHALVPGIKLNRHRSVVDQYNNAWDNAIDAGGYPPSLKVAA